MIFATGLLPTHPESGHISRTRHYSFSSFLPLVGPSWSFSGCPSIFFAISRSPVRSRYPPPNLQYFNGLRISIFGRKSHFGLLLPFCYHFEGRSQNPGLNRARVEGKVLGRPRVSADIEAKVVALRKQGRGMRAIARELGIGNCTVQRIVAA